MLFEQAQADLRRAFVGGGPGVVVSGLVWLAAGVAGQMQGIASGFAVLFAGGVAIFPLSLLLVRFGFRRAPHAAGNPGAAMVGESTFALVAGLLAAWLLLRHDPALVFGVAALAVGARYFLFRTAYGNTLFWVLGGAICLVGCLAIFPVVPLPGGAALVTGVLEIAFGTVLTMRQLRSEAV